MSSSFPSLFLVPLHSFVLNFFFIFHLSWKQQNIFIFHFIMGTTASTAKSLLHIPLHFEYYLILVKMSFSFNTFILLWKETSSIFLCSMSSSFSLKGLSSNSPPFWDTSFFPETYYSISSTFVLLCLVFPIKFRVTIQKQTIFIKIISTILVLQKKIISQKYKKKFQ